MKKSVIFTVKITTKAVEKEPEKIQAWSGMEPGPLRWPDATLYHWAN